MMIFLKGLPTFSVHATDLTVSGEAVDYTVLNWDLVLHLEGRRANRGISTPRNGYKDDMKIRE